MQTHCTDFGPATLSLSPQLGAALRHLHGQLDSLLILVKPCLGKAYLGVAPCGGTGHPTRWSRVLQSPAGTAGIHESSLQLAGTAAARLGPRGAGEGHRIGHSLLTHCLRGKPLYKTALTSGTHSLTQRCAHMPLLTPLLCSSSA